MSPPAATRGLAPLSGQHDVDEVLDLVLRGDRAWAPASAAVTGELVAPADELVDAFVTTLVASPQTQRTYQRACRRFVRWLGPLAGPEDLTAANLARYHAHLVAGGRSTATVRKDRAALNTFLRWLVAHDRVPAAQVRDALAVRLPRAQRAEPEAPKALTGVQYERLLRAAKARIADDPVAGARDLAIVRVLGDAGLRCEELARLQRRDFLPARKGAKLRRLDVRHGKGDRQRRVTLGAPAARAIVCWDRERTRVLGQPADDAPLFITLGRAGATAPTRASAASAAKACWRSCSSASAPPPSSRRSCATRTRCATPARPSCSGPAPRSPTCASSSATPRSRRRRSTWHRASSARSRGRAAARPRPRHARRGPRRRLTPEPGGVCG